MAVGVPDLGPDGGRPRRRVPWWVWPVLGCGCLVPIAVFAAILLPVFMQARARAAQIGCLSNIKQYASGIRMYAADNDETLPFAQGWMDATVSYGCDPWKLRCPSVVPRGRDAYGYAFDRGLSHKKVSDVENPAQEVDIFDSNSWMRNAVADPSSLPSSGRHMGRNNVGYVDGHTGSLGPDRQPIDDGGIGRAAQTEGGR